ncbi:hypothetical protein [Leptothermofonsia sp. ETS-13]|uniref:hypothetical protein n=1 Tax=Leptothermofonsia sp. ETS-13 TaxID=3035696 RepID=UPI003BA2FBCA
MGRENPLFGGAATILLLLLQLITATYLEATEGFKPMPIINPAKMGQRSRLEICEK